MRRDAPLALEVENNSCTVAISTSRTWRRERAEAEKSQSKPQQAALSLKRKC